MVQAPETVEEDRERCAMRASRPRCAPCFACATCCIDGRSFPRGVGVGLAWIIRSTLSKTSGCSRSKAVNSFFARQCSVATVLERTVALRAAPVSSDA